uniref:uncharacterized protein LOC114678305 isoform X2 n=1 Tax=Macaca mulatta TaxID=9544 RepID=UPI0010A222E4|nr:uncharacterized protein LOC114678305 isoform X2 [Macaca mulatta]
MGAACGQGQPAGAAPWRRDRPAPPLGRATRATPPGGSRLLKLRGRAGGWGGEGLWMGAAGLTHFPSFPLGSTHGGGKAAASLCRLTRESRCCQTPAARRGSCTGRRRPTLPLGKGKGSLSLGGGTHPPLLTLSQASEWGRPRTLPHHQLTPSSKIKKCGSERI